MARNTLEAVFGALGSGLVGYGRDQKRRYDESQDAADREERRKRQELADALQAAEMMESGRWGSEAQLRERTGGAAKTAMAAALSGFNASRGGPSRPVVPTDAVQAGGVARRGGMNAPQVSVGGQDLRMLQTADDERRMAQAHDKSLIELRGKVEGDLQAAAEKGRQTTAQTRLSAAMTPKDRVEQAVLAAVLKFSNTPISSDYGMSERLPTEAEIDQYTKQALRAATAVYNPSAAAGTRVSQADYDRAFEALGPDATDEAVRQWVRSNPGR